MSNNNSLYEENAGADYADEQVAYAPASRAAGLPLRGLAMVLIAVAILLIAWGVYSKLGKGESDPIATVTAPVTAPQQPGQPGQPGQPAQPGQPGRPGEAAPTLPAGNGDAAGNPTGEVVATGAPGAAAPGAGNAGGAVANGLNPATVNPADATANVVVLNNSTVQGLAASTADQLRAKFNVTEVGNYADDAFPKSVVFYQPGNREQEATAALVAQRLGVVAGPRPADLGVSEPGVVVILTQDLAR